MLTDLPSQIFCEAPGNKDALKMGWTCAPRVQKQSLNISTLGEPSAESTLGLAIMNHAWYQSKQSELPLTLEVDPSQHQLATDLGITQISAHKSSQRPLNRWEDLAGGKIAYPIESFIIGSPETAEKCATRTQLLIKTLANRLQKKCTESVLDIVRKVSFEAYLNIHDHAYPNSQKKTAFLCITVSRVGEVPSHALSNEDHWLHEYQGERFIEIAIGDAGEGIPKTLWHAAADRNERIKDIVEQIKNPDKHTDCATRAELHRLLCEDAFNHESTGKPPEERTSPLYRMNWRGLYRCQRQVAGMDGCIVIASGRARSGYARLDGTNRRFSETLTENNANDFPGTVVVLRLPVKTLEETPTHREEADTPLQELKLYDSENEVPTSDNKLKNELDTPRLLGNQNLFAPIQHSSDSIKTEVAWQKLLNDLCELPPSEVPVLLFTQMPPNPRSIFLGPIAEWREGYYGLPRVVCHWHPRVDRLRWMFVGYFPELIENRLVQLEENGVTELKEQDPEIWKSFARDLASEYHKFLHIDTSEGLIKFSHYNATISAQSINSIFSQWFNTFWKGSSASKNCIVGGNNQIVLLYTGRYVCRYLCVLFLVRKYPVLANILGWRLRQKLSTSYTKNGESVLVADQHGSRLIAQILLADTENRPSVYTFSDLLDRQRDLSRASIFVQAIFQGTTLGMLLEKLHDSNIEIENIITCVDLRPIKTPNFMDTTIEVAPLLSIDFKPGEVTSIENKEIIKIDSVTHVPTSSNKSEFSELGVNDDAQRFIDSHPDIFRHGIHWLAGRVHTVSLQSSFATKYRTTFTIMIVDKILQDLPALQPESTQKRDIVFFGRPDSNLVQIVDNIAQELRVRLPETINKIYFSYLDMMHRGSRTVFAQDSTSLLSSVSELAIHQRELFPASMPKAGYYAIYLEDAAISGNSLRDFLLKIASHVGAKPKRVLGMVLVNRLSPGESRFFEVCGHMTPKPQKNSRINKTGFDGTIPFNICSLFRLQVRSRINYAPTYHTIFQSVYENSQLLKRNLRDYIEDVKTKLSSVPPHDSVQHIFIPDASNDIATISIQATKLRHLLSLNQQNEVVLTEILNLLVDMLRIDNNDTQLTDRTVLLVFALEPELLEEPPLSVAFRADVTDLCVDTIIRNYPISIKSSALTILGQYRKELLLRLDQVAAHLLKDEALRLQLTVFLLTLYPRETKTFIKMNRALDMARNAAVADHVDHLKSLIRVLRSIDGEDGLIDDNRDALDKVHDLTLATFRHSERFRAWTGISSDLEVLCSQPRRVWSKITVERVRRSCPVAIDLVTTVLIPALHALLFLTRQSSTTADSYELIDVIFESQNILSHFTKTFDRLQDAVTVNDIKELSATIKALQRLLLVKNTTSILGDLSHPRPEAPIIERRLPLFFCNPLELMLLMVIDLDLSLDQWTYLVEPGNQQSLVQVPKRAMQRIFEPLLENISKYSIPTSVDVTKFISSDTLVIKIENEIRSRSGSRDSSGINISMAESKRHGIDVLSKEKNSGRWTTQVTIPGVIPVTIE